MTSAAWRAKRAAELRERPISRSYLIPPRGTGCPHAFFGDPRRCSLCLEPGLRAREVR